MKNFTCISYQIISLSQIICRHQKHLQEFMGGAVTGFEEHFESIKK